jgi:cytochrome P450
MSSFPFLVPSMEMIMIAVGAYAFYLVSSFVYLVHLHPLAKYPGPPLWAFSRVPWAWHIIKGDLSQRLDQLHERYGATVRIAPDEITTIEPAAWTDIYTIKPVLPKDPYSQTPPLNGAHSLFTAVGEEHKRIRGVLVHGFSEKALRDQASIIENHADKFVSRLRRQAATATTLDIQKLFGYATFDTITDLSFGESFNGLEGLKQHDEISAFFFHAKYGTIRNCLSRFFPLDLILGLFLLKLTSEKRRRNWQITTAKIERSLAKKESGHDRPDFLSPVISKIDEDGVKGITKKEVVTNGLAFVIADCQLTTVALTTMVYLLLRDSSTWRELSDEIRGRFNAAEEITLDSTRGLRYLEASIDETLRLHHPTPISLPRSVPTGGRRINGEFIPENMVVGINLQNIQNSPTLWEEPRVFHPERFLPRDDPRYNSRFDNDAKSAFLPFSTGSRNCLGARVFLAQARVIIAKLVYSFDLSLAHEHNGWLDQKAYLVFEPKALDVHVSAHGSKE